MKHLFSRSLDLKLAIATGLVLLCGPLSAQNEVPKANEPKEIEPAAPAQQVEKPQPPALLVLDPSEKVWSLKVSHGSRLNVKKGDVVINSAHQSALWNTDSQIEVPAGRIGVVGGVHQQRGATSPAPFMGIRPLRDPYPAFRVAAPENTVSRKKLFIHNGQGDITLRPGIYNDGIFAGGKDIRIKLEPGVYIMNGGDFFLSGGSLEGEGVTIVMSGQRPGMFWGAAGARMNLAAPTTGELKGLVLIARGQGWENVNLGTTEATFKGTIYAPNSVVGIRQKSNVSVDRIICLNLDVTSEAELTISGDSDDILFAPKDDTEKAP